MIEVTATVEQLYRRTRDVPDFPNPGVVFKDITPLLLDAALFRRAVELMAAPFRQFAVSRVISIESRGFLLGAPIALALEAGLVPMRKPGKLPGERGRVEYALEYGTDALEMHRDAVGSADRVLIVDDMLATGGTAQAAAKLVRAHDAERSEEHTSELQSRSDLVCRLLLEKKNKLTT